MTKTEKNKLISDLATELNNCPNLYVTDVSGMKAIDTNMLRRKCHELGVKMKVVKNTLLQKAMDGAQNDYKSIYDLLKGNTAIFFSPSGSTAAKMLKEFRLKNSKPLLKAVFAEDSLYLGDNQLELLASMKSKNELIGEVIGLLLSPARNVISALLSGKNKLAGIVKTLAEKKEQH